MRLRTHCVTCMHETMIAGGGPQEIAVTLLALRDDGKYDLVCPKGHEYALVIQGTKYEVLYEIALNAYRDGYYREAISSFAASLERFYEFLLGAIFHFTGQSPAFAASWTIVGAMSERQLGAYALCSGLHFGVAPKVLRPKFVELRNRVVHKGYIPQPEESLEFGQEVCEVIVAALDQVYDKYGDTFRDFYYAQMPQYEAPSKPILHYVMVGIRWEDIKAKESPSRSVRHSLTRMFGPGVV